MKLLSFVTFIALFLQCLIFIQETQASETAPEMMTIKVAALPYLSSAPLFIAQIHHYYEQQDINIEFHFKKSAQSVAQAVANEDVDIGVTGLTSGFLQLATQHPLRIIAGQYREIKGQPGSLFLASNQAYHDGLTSIDKLKGHEALGMTTEGSTFHRWFGALTQQLSLPLDGFSIHPCHTVQAMRTALINNDVDVIISAPLIALQLEKANHAKIIGKVADYCPGQLGVVFTTQKRIDEQRTGILQFLQAYQNACADYHRILIKKTNDEDFKQLLGAINRYLDPKLDMKNGYDSILSISADASFNKSDLEKTIKWYQLAGFLSDPLDREALFNLDLLREATTRF